jgi:hypothetical protein
MSKALTAAAAYLVVAVLSGCGSQAAWIYEPGERVSTLAQPIDGKVAVLALRDARQTENSNGRWIALIPFVPFGSASYDRPDAASSFLAHASYNARPSEDYAKAIVEELKVNMLFKDAFLTYRQDEPGVDWILTGEIKRTDYKGTMYTYCLSFYGSLFWLLGIPAGSAKNTLAVSLELKRVTDGHVLWRHDIEGSYGKVIGLYYNYSSELEGFPKILRAGLQSGIKELDQHIQKNGLTGIVVSQYDGMPPKKPPGDQQEE